MNETRVLTSRANWEAKSGAVRSQVSSTCDPARLPFKTKSRQMRRLLRAGGLTAAACVIAFAACEHDRVAGPLALPRIQFNQQSSGTQSASFVLNTSDPRTVSVSLDDAAWDTLPVMLHFDISGTVNVAVDPTAGIPGNSVTENAGGRLDGQANADYLTWTSSGGGGQLLLQASPSFSGTTQIKGRVTFSMPRRSSFGCNWTYHTCGTWSGNYSISMRLDAGTLKISPSAASTMSGSSKTFTLTSTGNPPRNAVWRFYPSDGSPDTAFQCTVSNSGNTCSSRFTKSGTLRVQAQTSTAINAPYSTVTASVIVHCVFVDDTNGINNLRVRQEIDSMWTETNPDDSIPQNHHEQQAWGVKNGPDTFIVRVNLGNTSQCFTQPMMPPGVPTDSIIFHIHTHGFHPWQYTGCSGLNFGLKPGPSAADVEAAMAGLPGYFPPKYVEDYILDADNLYHFNGGTVTWDDHGNGVAFWQRSGGGCNVP